MSERAGPASSRRVTFGGGECEDGCGPLLSLTHGLWRSLVSASVWGTEGRRFKSSQPDKVQRRSNRSSWVDMANPALITAVGHCGRHLPIEGPTDLMCSASLVEPIQRGRSVSASFSVRLRDLRGANRRR